MSPESHPRGGEDNVEMLIRRARVRPLLTAAEEVRLAQRIERGDPAARELMIESNLRLVLAMARSYRAHGVPFADLVQEGTVGLVRAVERFDHRRGVKFSTHAVWWIRRSLLDAVSSSQAIRIPAKARQQLSAVRRAEAAMGNRGGHAPIAAITQLTGLSASTVRSLRSVAQVTASLDEPIGDDTTALGDLVADDRAVDPPERALAQENQREVWWMLRLLPERHREVLIRRYGLNDGQRSESHEQIGRVLGVGQERSRQIEREALHRLRTIAPPPAKAA